MTVCQLSDPGVVNGRKARKAFTGHNQSLPVRVIVVWLIPERPPPMWENIVQKVPILCTVPGTVQYCTVSFGPKNKTKTNHINMLKSRGPLHMPLWPFLAAAALFGTFSGPQHLTQELHPETGRRSARAAMSRPAAHVSPSPIHHSHHPSCSCRYGSGGRGGCTETCVDGTSDGFCDDGGPGAEYSMCNLGTDCTDCGSRLSTTLLPPLAPPYLSPPGYHDIHIKGVRLAFAATGIAIFICLVRAARIGMGEDVMVNGRRGKITSDDGTSNPYKVTFDNGEVSGWL